jgi:hypothetical protein
LKIAAGALLMALPFNATALSLFETFVAANNWTVVDWILWGAGCVVMMMLLFQTSDPINRESITKRPEAQFDYEAMDKLTGEILRIGRALNRADLISKDSIQGALEELFINTDFLNDEKFDVVDDRDQVVGVISRSLIYYFKLRHRTTHVLVVARDGHFILPQRAAHISSYLEPSRLSLFSGHVDAGENYHQAIWGKLVAELGFEHGKKLAGFLVSVGSQGMLWDSQRTSEIKNYYIYFATQEETDQLLNRSARLRELHLNLTDQEFDELLRLKAKHRPGFYQVQRLVLLDHFSQLVGHTQIVVDGQTIEFSEDVIMPILNDRVLCDAFESSVHLFRILQQVGDEEAHHDSSSPVLAMPADARKENRNEKQDPGRWAKVVAEIERQKQLVKFYWDRWPVLFKAHEKILDQERRYRTLSPSLVVSHSAAAVRMSTEQLDVATVQQSSGIALDWLREISARIGIAAQVPNAASTITIKSLFHNSFLSTTLAALANMDNLKAKGVWLELLRQVNNSLLLPKVTRVQSVFEDALEKNSYSEQLLVVVRKTKKITYTKLRYYFYFVIRMWKLRPYLGQGSSLRSWLLAFRFGMTRAIAGLGHNDQARPEYDYSEYSVAATSTAILINTIGG